MATATKKPTQLLKEEHDEVLGKLKALEDIFGRLDKPDQVQGDLKRLAAFFETDFWVHFTKEEDALFPELEKFIPRNMGPIGVMLEEHEELRKTNDEIQRLVPAYLKDSTNTETQTQLKRYGNRFIYALRDHIDKENNVLFMMVEMHLDRQQLATVTRLFEQIAAEHQAKQAGDCCC